MRSSHSLDRVAVAFDDERLIGDAGLLFPATLVQHLGLREVVDAQVDLGVAAGRAHAGEKLVALVASALAGGDCIDDADALRAGGTAAVLGQRVPAPSTLGTFLRSFRWGHVRQLDAVSGACSPAPGRPARARAPSRSRSTSIPRSARPTDCRRMVPGTTATPTSAATTRCSRSRPGRVTCSTRGYAAATRTPVAARGASSRRRSSGYAQPARPAR